MRTLLLVRHAKARKADRQLSVAIDLARPLNDRGRTDARKMGKRLAKLDLYPDLIWVSPARRALETARILAKRLGYRRKDIKIDPRLYGSTAPRLRQLVRGLSRKRARVLLCGHNPELFRLARRLGSNLEELPTCGVVQLSFAVESWSEVGQVTLAHARYELARVKLRHSRTLATRGKKAGRADGSQPKKGRRLG
jgi:phosphohistidine phosphatase